MKVFDIKWDLEDLEDKELKNTLPIEIEIPNNLLDGYNGTNFETYYPDISDWLAREFKCDHWGFEISK